MRKATFRTRIGRVLEWSAVDRCLLVAAIALPLVTLYAIAARLVLARPELFPWADLAAIETATVVQRYLITCWLALVAVSVAMRTRAPGSRFLMHVTVQLYFVGTLVISSFLGVHTNNLVPFILLAGAAVGSMLFDRGVILPGMTSFVLGRVAMTAAEQAGWIREAPALRIAPL